MMTNPRIKVVSEPMFDPVWYPLEQHLGLDRCGDYMFMASYMLADRTVVHTYKHCDTRQYINLSADGRQWAYSSAGLYGASYYSEVH